MTNLEIKKQFEKITFDNTSDIIVSKGLFFKENLPEQKLNQKIRTYNIFFDSIAKVAKSKKRLHLQVPESLSGAEISYFFDELSEVAKIKRSRIPSHVMLYKENDLSKIAKRVIKKTLPAYAIEVVYSKMSDVSRKMNFNFISKEKSEYSGPKPSDVAIVIDKDFSLIKAEELHLSDYNVIDIFKNKRSKGSKEDIPRRVSLQNEKKIEQALQIHSDLKKKASEFLHNAMSYKRKSDEVKKTIDKISKKSKEVHTNSQDTNFALKQCKIDELNYSSMSKDFLQLYDEINSQIGDVKEKIKKLKSLK